MVLASKYVTHKSKRMEDTSHSQSKEKLLRTGKAADALGVSCNTLRTWANQALINFQITPGGQRQLLCGSEVTQGENRHVRQPV